MTDFFRFDKIKELARDRLILFFSHVAIFMLFSLAPKSAMVLLFVVALLQHGISSSKNNRCSL